MCFSLCFPWVFRFRNIWKIVLPLLGLSSPNLKVTMRCFFLTVFFTREICWKQFNHGLRGHDTNLFRTESFKFFLKWSQNRFWFQVSSVEFFQSTDSCLKLYQQRHVVFQIKNSTWIPANPKFQVFQCSFLSLQGAATSTNPPVLRACDLKKVEFEWNSTGQQGTKYPMVIVCLGCFFFFRNSTCTGERG